VEKIDLDEAVKKFKPIPGCIIDSPDDDALIKNWKAVVGSAEARKDRGIVYIWRTTKPIARLKGESPILYIGKTVNSLFDRHYGYAKIEVKSAYNGPRLKHILKEIGSIEMLVCLSSEFGLDPKKAEEALLIAYYDRHYELPPFNRMSL